MGRPPKPEFGTGGHETIGSLLRRKRFLEGPPPKRRLGSVEMRKARASIQNDADTVESCFRWLLQVAKAGNDPRAIAAMIEHWEEYVQFNPLASSEDCELVMKTIAEVMEEYRKRFPVPPPRVVK